MKRLAFAFVFMFIVAGIKANAVVDTIKTQSNDCEIEAFFEKEELPQGTQIIDNYGSIREARYLLTPVVMDEGNYEAVVTRRESNLYQIDRSNYYIRTKYCYEFSYSDKVVLQVNSRYSYSKGKMIFLD